MLVKIKDGVVSFIPQSKDELTYCMSKAGGVETLTVNVPARTKRTYQRRCKVDGCARSFRTSRGLVRHLCVHRDRGEYQFPNRRVEIQTA